MYQQPITKLKGAAYVKIETNINFNLKLYYVYIMETSDPKELRYIITCMIGQIMREDKLEKMQTKLELSLLCVSCDQ
jgi:hypothetical protein